MPRLSHRESLSSSRSAFTLVELLIVIAIIAILSVVVIMAINPVEMLRKARDSNRSADLNVLNKALSIYNTDQPSGSLGSPTIVYVSLPDSSATCANLGLPTLPSGYTYACATTANLRKTDGTGWIPVNLASISFGTPLATLPIDPVNTISTGFYYTYIPGGSWELTATPESSTYKLGGTKDKVSTDGGDNPSQMEVGTNLQLLPIEYGDTSLVGYWNFEEGTGNTTSTDRSGYGNNGKWYGAGAHYTTGKVGSWAGQFVSSTNDYINILNNPLLNFGTGNFSISVWVYSLSYNASAGIVSKNLYWTTGPGYTLTNISSPLTVWFVTYDGANQRTLNSSVGSSYGWTYLTAVKRGGVTEIWVNAAKISEGVAPPNTFDNAFDLTLGRGPSGQWAGSMDDVRIYNRALSAAEILAIYNATK